ncbi:GntR family transcriptional regulator [Micromonospora haikouensis]|uniref:GntR family transcriptional regulator n=1 Tax=Micromonospora haikouensis TaxID=686309 RepID=UPI003448A2E5
MTSCPAPSRWRSIRDDLRAGIKSGMLKPGQQILTTQKLMEQYSTSSATVRRAVDSMIEPGELIGRQGMGVFVTTSSGQNRQDICFSPFLPGRLRLVASQEVREMLGVSRTRAYQITHSKTFPDRQLSCRSVGSGSLRTWKGGSRTTGQTSRTGNRSGRAPSARPLVTAVSSAPDLLSCRASSPLSGE